jgi:hypothetical protein
LLLLLKTRPNGQFEQEEEPAEENVLAGQRLHLVAFPDEKEFGGH